MKRKGLITKLFALSLAAGALVGIASCGKKGGKTVITAATNGSPAPFIEKVDSKDDALYTTGDGTHLSGYDIAVITEVFKLPELADYELKIQLSTNTIVDAQQGTVDFAINNYSYNEERAKSFLFSYPYTKSRYTITAKPGINVGSFEELAESGLKIYGGAGGNTTNAIDRWNAKRTPGQKKINIEYTSVDITAQLEEAIAGNVALIHDQPVILKYAKSYPNQFSQLNITVLSDTETATNITANNTSHLLFGKTGPNADKYRKLLSEGIETLYNNGKLEELGKKYIAEALGDNSVSVLPNKADLKYLN